MEVADLGTGDLMLFTARRASIWRPLDWVISLVTRSPYVQARSVAGAAAGDGFEAYEIGVGSGTSKEKPKRPNFI